jgi:hypothetical protein
LSFFDDAPSSQEALGRHGIPWEPPGTEFPGAVSIGPLALARTEAVAVAIIGMWAFKTGFEFCYSTRFRNSQPPASGELAPQESAHVGLQFADGRTVSNVGASPPQPNGLVLTPLGISGGFHYRNWSYWAWPLPPPGPVIFVFEWQAANISEKQVSIDARPILDAASHSIQIWSEDGDNEVK